jgi:hypothetical protein
LGRWNANVAAATHGSKNSLSLQVFFSDPCQFDAERLLNARSILAIPRCAKQCGFDAELRPTDAARDDRLGQARRRTGGVNAHAGASRRNMPLHRGRGALAIAAAALALAAL